MPIPPSGQQFHITAGDYDAVVTEAGATLRSLRFRGCELLWTFGEDEAPRSSMGRHLVPWPNRIRDGRYTFEGRQYQLPITEVPRHNAIHGLGDGSGWRLTAHTAAQVVLTTTIFAQKGWDAVLEVELAHELDAELGLSVTMTARNVGARRAPFGYGAHPYLAVDPATTELTLPFSRELLVDAERLLPIELTEVSAEADFRVARALGDTVLDTAFTGVEGDWVVSVATAERTTLVWADDAMGWGQVFTPPTRDALAVEPMTCGPDAFNEGPTHDDLIVLDPGADTRCAWGIRVV